MIKNYLWVSLWALLVLILCLIPPDQVGANRISLFLGADKLVHAGFFYIFSILFIEAQTRTRSTRGLKGFSMGVLFRVAGVATLFACLTEFLQWKIFIYRTGDWWDLLADSIGIGMGMFAYIILSPRKAPQ